MRRPTQARALIKPGQGERAAIRQTDRHTYYNAGSCRGLLPGAKGVVLLMSACFYQPVLSVVTTPAFISPLHGPAAGPPGRRAGVVMLGN